MRADYHLHTSWCDGKATPAEMAEAALAAGTNVNTLNTRLRRAKGLLQAELKGWYFDEED